MRPASFYPTIGIIGAGRLGSALARALPAAGYPLAGIASRTPTAAAALADGLGQPASTSADLARRADLIVLAVPDDALAALAAHLSAAPATPGQAIIHCSGALSADVLAPLAAAGWQIGACHPLQAFATTSAAIQPGITWAIEAAEPLRATLRRLAEDLGGRPLELRAEDKVLYHAAAVIAANFAITLAERAVAALGLCAIPADAALAALLPLLQGNLDNLARVGLPDALTGPLARGDLGTVERHLAALDERAPAIAALYRACVIASQPLIEHKHAAR